MLTLCVMRHGSTSWNEQRLIQGRRDIPLSALGRAEVAAWRIPAPLQHDERWVSSPLCRATETARLLGRTPPRIEPALIEMDWGRWEGLSLEALRARYGDAFASNERRGLDFRPEGGESPREVLARVRDWLRELARNGRPTVAVTHKGVLRVLLVAATGWDMIDKPPVTLQSGCLHRFAVGADGTLAVMQCNIPLVATPAPEAL